MGAADSKLAFRKGVFRLYEDKNILTTDNEFWEQFWNLPESADDIFSLVGANDIRRARDTARENLEILIDKILDKMQAILKAKNFPTEQYSINQLLNCCRVMTRIMPFVFESSECMEWEETFFWTPRQVEKETKSSDNKPEYEMLPCRGEFLLNLTIQALFLAGFTIPISLANKDSKVNYAIWENGVGSTIPISTYKDNEANRTEVLRLLAVLLSKSMYVPPQQLLSKEDLWLRYVAVKIERKVVLVILCSLLNTICNYDPTGWVPYNHVVNTGPKEQLVSFCLTNLLVLLDYRSPQQVDLLRQHDTAAAAAQSPTLENSVEVLTLIDSSPDSEIPKTSIELQVFSPPVGGNGSHQKVEQNAFRHYMSKLHRKQDFEFLFNGIHRLLTNPMTAVNTYLPGSTKRVGCYVDVMMMCWRLIETNSRFTKYLIESDRVLDLTVDLIFHAIDNKDKLSQIGLVRICAFILQTLSSNKDYSHKLNKPFTTHGSLPASIRLYAFNGTYAEFLIISIFTLIATTQGKLSTLYPALILTISNISPYLINLGVTTCSKLMTLFHSMSSPSFLLADESNFQLTSYLLETFNHIIHYQFAENSNLVYSIVLHHDYFEKLDKLTFKDAVAEVERLRALKEAAPVVDPATVVAAPTTTESPTAMTPTVNSQDVSADSTTVAKQQDDGTNADAVTENTEIDNTEDKKVTEEESKKEEEEEVKEQEVKEEESPKTEEKDEITENTEEVETTEKQPLIPQEQEVSSSSTPIPQQQDRHDSTDTTAVTTTSPLPPIVIRTRNGFIPSEAWMTFWKSKLPLSTILSLIKLLVPQVEEKCKENKDITLEELMGFLKTIQVPAEETEQRSIFIRKFQWGEALVIWFRSMMWGQNYVSSMKEHGAWNGTLVKLFQIKEE